MRKVLGFIAMVVFTGLFVACTPAQIPEAVPEPEPIATLIDGLSSGKVTVVDLTQPLNAETPIIQLPPPLANTPGFTSHLISNINLLPGIKCLDLIFTTTKYRHIIRGL